jgi:proteasome lid subunit RPN8/RPN11
MKVKRKVMVRLIAGSDEDKRYSCMPIHRSQWWVAAGAEEELGEPAVSIFLSQKAYVRICAHAGSDLDNEIGGWMAGKRCTDRVNGKPFIVIDTILPAEYTNQGPAHLTFTGDSQVALHTYMEKYFPKKVLLGWYHTHPGMGVFLSNWDLWLHQNFFPESWQVALVVEPHSSIGGFFIRQVDGRLDTNHYYGFYELLGHAGRSVVFWNNLQTIESIGKELTNE